MQSCELFFGVMLCNMHAWVSRPVTVKNGFFQLFSRRVLLVKSETYSAILISLGSIDRTFRFFMRITSYLSNFLEESPVDVSQLTTFAEHVPSEWVAAAASLSTQATIRRRRLPSDMVLWLIVGMAFFRNEPIAEVARRMNICAEGLADEALLAKRRLTQACQRLGSEAPKWLFKKCSEILGKERYPEDDWHGLQVLLLMVRYSEQETPQSFASTSALGTPRVNVKEPIQFFDLSP